MKDYNIKNETSNQVNGSVSQSDNGTAPSVSENIPYIQTDNDLVKDSSITTPGTVVVPDNPVII